MQGRTQKFILGRAWHNKKSNLVLQFAGTKSAFFKKGSISYLGNFGAGLNPTSPPPGYAPAMSVFKSSRNYFFGHEKQVSLEGKMGIFRAVAQCLLRKVSVWRRGYFPNLETPLSANMKSCKKRNLGVSYRLPEPSMHQSVLVFIRTVQALVEEKDKN